MMQTDKHRNASVFILAMFLNSVRNTMTIPMLNICTPPPAMYSMNACTGRAFARDMVRFHARLKECVACYAKAKL